MRPSSRGNLRAVPVDQGALNQPDPNLQQAQQLNAGLDEIDNLPAAPQPINTEPGEQNKNRPSMDDIDALPAAGGNLKPVYDIVYHGDPDNVAKVIDTSNKLQADPIAVAGSLKDAQKAASVPPENFFQSVEDRYPGTTEFLKDPKNMAVAHDDLPNVAQHEDLVQKVQSAYASEKNAFMTGALQEELAFMRYHQMQGETVPENEHFRMGGWFANEAGAPMTNINDRAAWIQGKLDELNKGKPGVDAGWIKRGLYGATEFAPQIAGGAMYGSKYGIPAAAGAEILQALTRVKIPGATAMAGRAGFAYGEAEYNYKLMTGMAYDNLSKVRDDQGQPLPQNVIRIASLATGAAGAGLGLVKLGAVLESIPGGKEFLTKFSSSVPEAVLKNPQTMAGALKTFASNYATSVAHGTGAMAGITAVNIAGERGAEAASGQQFSHAGEPGVMSQIGESAEDAALTFGVLGAFGPTAGLYFDAKDARRAKTSGDFFRAFGDTAEASKIRERLPEAHQQLINRITKDSPVENLFIPQEAFNSYFQSKGIDPSVVADELGIKDQHQEAVATGGDVKVPLDVFASRVAGTEHYQGLAGDIKFNADDLTQNQVEERRAQIADEIKKVQAQAEGTEPAPTSTESSQKIYDERYKQMVDSGISPVEARQAAAIHEAAFRSLGERTGQDPYELAKRFQLEIQRRESMSEAEGKSFSQDHLDDKTQEVAGPESVYGEVPDELPSYATGEQKFIEQAAKINLEMEKLSGEDTPEAKARIEELRKERIELVKTHQKKTDVGGTWYQDVKGRITFKGSKAIIDLFKGADRSTFLHETGHYFLEIMNTLSKDENAPESVKKDMKAIRDWMGLKDGEDIKTEHHEQFARGFEAYLREGKAPSNALAKAFGKFKQWLTTIYKSARSLNVELSPQIREVMDRMLATDKEIKEAQTSVGYNQDIAKSVPKHLVGRMNDLAETAREKAHATLMKEQMAEIEDSNKNFVAGERVRLGAEAETKAANEPVFKAQSDIEEALNVGRRKKGPQKSAVTAARKLLDGKLSAEDSAHFEVAAEVNGFKDGTSLANDIISAEANGTRQQIIDEHVAQEMRPHANLMDKISIKEQALRAIHSDHMVELLSLERQIFSGEANKMAVGAEVSRRQRVEARVAAAEAKEQASQILDGKPLRDAGNFRIYTTAERHAAVKAELAVRRKDFEAAAEYKRQQMLNHALASEAMKNRAEGEKTVRFLEKAADRNGDMKDMPYSFNKQIDQILERFGVKEKGPDDSSTMMDVARDMQQQGETPDRIANATGMVSDPQSGQMRPETLRDFIQRVNAVNYDGWQLPESILSGQGADDYKDLKMGDLKDLKDAVRNLQRIGKMHDRFLNDFIQITMNEAGDRFKQSVEENIGSPYAAQKRIGTKYKNKFSEMVDRIKNLPDSIAPSMVNMLTLCTYLDGGEANGPAHDYIYRPLKQAEDRKFARLAKMREDVSGENGLFSKFYTKQELAGYKDKVEQMPGGQWLTRENVLAMALNWGNEQNRDRIRMGYGERDATGRLIPMSDETIKSLFDRHLRKKDWDFAQAAWDHLDSYWHEIAGLEMKMRGVEPERVVPAPFENQHGSFKGGYYPISYDFEKSDEAYKNQQQLTEEFQQYSAASAHTDRGHAIARVSFVARPVDLTLRPFFNHLENVIHDLEFRPAIVDTAKFLQMPDVRNSIQNAIGMEGYRGIDQWLKDQGSSQSENLTWIDKALQWSRFGTTISALGLTPKAFLLHFPSNIFNSMWETGVVNTTKFMTKAAIDVAMGRGELKDFVFDKSERMKQRLTVRDRDIMEMAKQWDGTAAGAIPHYAFMSLHLADEAVSIPLWADTYQKNVVQFGEAKAIELADETVTKTLGSGSKVDQIGFQRGSQKTKLFTMFYSWMSVMFNRAWLDGKVAGLEYRQGNVGTAASIVAKATFFAWLLPAAHEVLLQEAMHNGQSTDDERKKRAISKFVEAPFGMMPFVRDIVPPAIHTAMGEHGNSDIRFTPVEMAYQNLMKPAADTGNIMFGNGKHLDEKYAEEVARGMSQAAGYPQQLNTWAFNFFDFVQHNGEASWKDFLSRRHKK